MASWNIPALINKISEDVPAIKALLTALFKWTDAGTTDVPEGAKRLQSVTGGRQIQEYSGSSWGSVGKLMHDVDMLDGKHATTAQTPNTIPVRDANGSIPGNITGNAATATSTSGLASDYVVPIANGGTGATSAANARTNLGTNNAANITQGVLATARGGTGRSDGKVTDVFLTDYQTGAVGLGQLGQAVTKNAVDCDTLTRQGKYYCTGATLALHYPIEATQMVEVTANGTMVVQRTYGSQDNNWHRHSFNGGASWQPWMPDALITGGNVNIYISKGGSDSNIGISSTAPVLTWNRALNIAKRLSPSGTIAFFCGPGEWGDVTIYISDFTCANVCVTNYVNSQKNTTTDFEALTGTGNTGNQPPHFTSLNILNGLFYLGNINADIIALTNAYCYGGSNCFKFGRMTISSGWFSHGNHLIVNNISSSAVDAVFAISKCYFSLGNSTIKFVNSPTNVAFISCNGMASISIGTGLATSGTFSGAKFIFSYPPMINSATSLPPQSWPGVNSATSYPFFFGSTPYLAGGIREFSSTMTKGTVPSAATAHCLVELLEKNGMATAQANRIGILEAGKDTAGNTQIYLCAYRNTAGSTEHATLSLIANANGTQYATCPTPALDDNSNKIATTSWARTASGNTSLNAATATKLATARIIFGQNFDGTGNIGGRLDAENIELSGYPNVHGGFIDFHYGRSTADYTSRIIEYDSGMITLEGELFVTNMPNAYPHIRIACGSKCFFFRNDGENFYLLKTADNNAKGQWDTTRPIVVHGDTGKCDISGNAATATKSNTADTPAADDNSTRTATTAWVRGRLSGSEYSMVPSANPEQRSVGTTYTAGTNGFFKVETNDIGDYWAGVWINGHESRVHIGEYGSGGNWSGNLVFIPVKKGWTYSCYSCSWCAFQAAG